MKKVLFIRSPRYRLSWSAEYISFQFPLGLCSIAAFLQSSLPKLDVEIIDCPAEKIGWRTLTKILKEKQPDVVAAGEPQSFYYHETIKVFKITKSISPKIITIAGGPFFSAMSEFVLKNFKSVDYIIKGEGEITLTKLIEAIIEKGNIAKVKGIVFRENDNFIHTSPRPLIANLDDLSIPCYEMLPVENYRWDELSSKNYIKSFYKKSLSKDTLPSILIETSRGCPFQCDFCNLWYFWGKKEKTEMIEPFYRRKSVDRVIKEIEICYEKYGRRFFFFVDSFFNHSEKWTNEFCNKLITKGYKDLKWYSYLRCDSTIKDEKNNLLKKMIECGLSSIQIGAERDPDSLIKYKGKTEEATEVTSILKKKYPRVKIISTFLIGFQGDSYMTIINQSLYSLRIGPSYVLPVFPMPFPGTMLYDNSIKAGKLNDNDFIQTNYSSHHIVYKLGKMNKSRLFFFVICINPSFLNLLLTLYQYKNLKFAVMIISRIVYRNKFSLILSMFIYFLLITPFVLLLIAPPLKTFWQWKKPHWYNT